MHALAVSRSRIAEVTLYLGEEARSNFNILPIFKEIREVVAVIGM